MKKITYYYNYINPTPESNPEGAFAPACRGQDQLNIYTYDFKDKTKDNFTGTNPWGIEASIDKNGIVKDISCKVKIPFNGFVLSGNSKGFDFINNNISLGSKVVIDISNHTIIVETDPVKTKIITLNNKRKHIYKMLNVANKNAYLLNYDLINKNLNDLNNINIELKNNKKNIRKFNQIYKKALNIVDTLYLLCSNSPMVFSRGCWERPEAKNLNELIKRLNIMKKCNINTFYVESFYNGNIPGISSITETSEEVRDGDYGKYGNDYLLALISEAHKRNIEVHAWVECFFVGEKSSQWKDRYPDSWHMVNYNGTFVQGKGDGNSELVENDFVFLDPANPECHQYVLSIYKELLTKYDFDGINVDYIRYPHGNYQLSTSNGYSDYAMNEFKKIYNLAGDVRELVKDNKINSLWTKYRCDKITLLMKEIKELVNTLDHKVLISMSVVPETNYAINNKMQDWVSWVKKGYIDITFPMAYYFGCEEVAKSTKELVKFNNLKAFSYTGIAPNYIGGKPILAAKQINTVFENGAEGYCIFSFDSISKDKQIQKVLRLGPNKNKAVSPHSDYKKICNMFYKEFALKKTHFINVFQEDENNFSYILKQIGNLKYSKDITDCINNVEIIKALIKINFNKQSLLAATKELNYLLHILTIHEYINEKSC